MIVVEKNALWARFKCVDRTKILTQTQFSQWCKILDKLLEKHPNPLSGCVGSVVAPSTGRESNPKWTEHGEGETVRSRLNDE